MRTSFGIDAQKKKDQNLAESVTWDSELVVNGHMLLMGMSGAGKTYTLMRMIREMQSSSTVPVRFHVFDVHGDIDIPGASTVLFSEQTEYGLNPLIVNPDPHFGGVRKRIQGLISTLNKVGRQMGGKQEAVLRNILMDLYMSFGFKPNAPESWHVDHAEVELEIEDGRLYLDVPIEEKDEAKQCGARWDPERRSWFIAADAYQGFITRWQPKRAGKRHPTMHDALRYARRMIKTVFLGSSQEAVNNLEAFNRISHTYHGKVLATMKKGDKKFDDPKMLGDLEKAGDKAKAAFAKYIDSIKSGRELDDLIKYDSFDVMKSVVDRLENLNAIGIFKNKVPPFNPTTPIWRYHLTALSMEERKLFVLFKLEEIFAAAVERGQQRDIVEVVVLDEAHIYADDDPENIINNIAKEARKFGLALICASQSPTHFTDDFVSSVATKVILGIDEMFWDGATRKLKLDARVLPWIRPKKSLAVQIKQSGEARNIWTFVLSPGASPD